MTLIDNRILIPASQERIWALVSDLQQNPQWQVDCEAVSILTTMKSGQGTRWRSVSKSGREQVLEITAWYDRLGYEYRIVDGTSLQSNKGLFRLQEIPEGTIVQWTFSYEPAGFLSGLQDSLRTRRKLESEIVDSLRQLYRVMTNRSQPASFETKALIREAPDVEARAHYQPRHPSNVEGVTASASSESSPAPARPVPAEEQITRTGIDLTPEPHIAEGDTRPNPAVSPTAVQPMEQVEPAEPIQPTPTEVTETTAPAARQTTDADADAAFRPPAPTVTSTPAVPVADPDQTDRPAVPDTLTSEMPVSETAETVEISSISSLPSVSEEAPVSTSVTPAPQPEPAAEPITAMPNRSETVSKPDSGSESILDTREVDTAKISVFELFGIPRPSETQETRRIDIPQISDSSDLIATVIDDPVEQVKPVEPVQPTKSEPVSETSPDPAAIAEIQQRRTVTTTAVVVGTYSAPYTGRIGLRWRMRQKAVSIRRPRGSG